uniref:CCHC-type domain-containing protein n=1 Tax=Plectus sambesii TaxID=2011161 RepID=A0A914UIQ6_9BILA
MSEGAELIAELQGQVKTLKESLSNQTSVLEELSHGRNANAFSKVGTFSGMPGESWNDFLEKWELLTTAKALSPEKKLLNLPLHLSGVAFDQFRALRADQKDTYDELKRALTNAFSTETQVQDVTRELHQIRQGRAESVNEFAARLRTLSRSSAYKGLEPEAQNCILKELFCEKLRDEIRLLMSLAGTPPKTFEEAIAAARRFESSDGVLGPLLKSGIAGEKRPGKINSQIYATETGVRRAPSPNRNYATRNDTRKPTVQGQIMNALGDVDILELDLEEDIEREENLVEESEGEPQGEEEEIEVVFQSNGWNEKETTPYPEAYRATEEAGYVSSFPTPERPPSPPAVIPARRLIKYCPTYFQSCEPLEIVPMGEVPFVSQEQAAELLIQRLEQAEQQIVWQEGRMDELEGKISELGSRPPHYWGPGPQWKQDYDDPKELRFRFTAAGAPICTHCSQANHIRRDCPQRQMENCGGNNQNNGGFGQGNQVMGRGAGRGVRRYDQSAQGFDQRFGGEYGNYGGWSNRPVGYAPGLAGIKPPDRLCHPRWEHDRMA